MPEGTAVYADEIVGRMSAAYAYALNDILLEYGAMKTDAPGEALIDTEGGEISPGGTVYADMVNFDANNDPYMVVFTANSVERTAEAHI